MSPESFEIYSRLILDERHWSWTLLVSLYLLIGLLLRGMVLGSLISQAKLPPARYYASIKHNYLRRAFSGWLSFYLGALLTALAWLKAREFPLSKEAWSFIFGAGLFYIWSLLLHAKALGAAALDTLRETAIEKDAESLIKSKNQDT